MSDSTIRFPQKFQGIFKRSQASFAPHLQVARKLLNSLNIPAPLQHVWDYVVVDNPQPSFILLPLLYLSLAEQLGGITPAHQRALPVIMLTMEAVAVMDDTVDIASRRSERATVPARFGVTQATPIATSLTATIAELAVEIDPRLVQPTMNFLRELGALQIWEVEHSYPEQAEWDEWMQQRYRQGQIATEFALNLALMYHHQAPFPATPAYFFAQIMQDVDDVVGLLEQRVQFGEGCDLQRGRVIAPLADACDNNIQLASLISQLWRKKQALLAESNQTTFQQLNQHVLEAGLATTLDRLTQIAIACEEQTPPALQAWMHDVICTFMARLSGVGLAQAQTA